MTIVGWEQPPMTRLCDLAEKYRCDKVKTIHHDYTPFYHGLLQGRKIRRMLEIGIGTPDTMRHVEGYKPGASLRMWQEYLPETLIWGADIDRSVLFDEGHIITLYLDQSNKDSLSTLAAVNSKFDFIIDDGSHQFDHQLLTANTLIPSLLSPTGVYVIEDVIWRRELYAELEFPVEVYIGNLKHTPDDCLFYVEGSKL